MDCMLPDPVKRSPPGPVSDNSLGTRDRNKPWPKPFLPREALPGRIKCTQTKNENVFVSERVFANVLHPFSFRVHPALGERERVLFVSAVKGVSASRVRSVSAARNLHLIRSDTG